MTEAEWVAATVPQPLLQHVRGKASERKLRLFAVACCRRPGCSLPGVCRHAVGVAERHADGAAPDLELLDAYAAAYAAWKGAGPFAPRAGAGAARAAGLGSADPARQAQRLRRVDVLEAAGFAAAGAAESVAFATAGVAPDPSAVVRHHHSVRLAGPPGVDLVGFEAHSVDAPAWTAAVAAERRAQCQLLRDLLGNPFRPVPAVDPAWLAWHGGAVSQLARAAYAERRLPEGELGPARLGVLADALEDAGCADADLLGHLRGPGPHVRGCWAVDLILSKG